MRGRNNNNSRINMSNATVLCLPEEDEIETTYEKRISESSCLVERTIRYKSGLQVQVVEDFMGRIYHFSMKSSKDSLRIVRNRTLFTNDC